MEILLISVSILMFLEGAALSTVVGLVTKQPKWALPLLVILWPIGLPFLGAKTYLKYKPLITQLQSNPMFSAMLGIGGPGLSTPQPTQTPLAFMGKDSGPTELERLMQEAKEAQEASPSEEEDNNDPKGEQ